MTATRTAAPIGAATGALGLVASGALAGPERITYPGDYRSAFTHYLKVDRPDRQTVRFFYVNPEALAAAVPGEPLPDGTVLVMEDHPAQLDADEQPVTDAEGRFVPTDQVSNVFGMEKRPGWGAEYPPERRNGEWEYAWFLPDGSRKPDATFDGCFGCHLNRAERDYTFTFFKYVLDTKRP